MDGVSEWLDGLRNGWMVLGMVGWCEEWLDGVRNGSIWGKVILLSVDCCEPVAFFKNRTNVSEKHRI